MKAPEHPLAIATLQEMGTQPTNPNPVGDPIQVQFNPTTLRLAMQNSVDMKKAFGKRPATQYDGTSSSVLTFDLVFDCADEGTTQSPVDVRTRVAPIEKFLLPKAGQKKSIPPRVQFTYGSLQLIGVMTSLNAEYDLFSTEGIPLRAKLGVTIKEQLPEYEQGAVGSGANDGAAAQDSAGLLPAGAGPGGAAPSQTGTALAGESAPDFAARMGLDPAAWKGLELGGLDPLSLTAGASIDFGASLTVDLGVTAGVTVGASAGAALLGGVGPASATAITAAGGLQRALDRDAVAAADAAAGAARTAFDTPRASSAATATRQVTTAGTATAPILPARVDRRELTFGYGVPLRTAIGAPDPDAELPRWYQHAASGDAPTTDDPSVPGWVALRPARGSGGAGGQCGGRCATSGCGCGCAGSGCGCGCGGASRGVRAALRPVRPAATPVTATPRMRASTPARSGCGGCRGCG